MMRRGIYQVPLLGRVLGHARGLPGRFIREPMATNAARLRLF
jgi:hypothetical protein